MNQRRNKEKDAFQSTGFLCYLRSSLLSFSVVFCFQAFSPCLSSCLCCIKCLYCLLTFKAAHFFSGLRCRIAKVCLNGFTLLFVLKVVLYEKLYPAKKCATLSVSAFWPKLLKCVLLCLICLKKCATLRVSNMLIDAHAT